MKNIELSQNIQDITEEDQEKKWKKTLYVIIIGQIFSLMSFGFGVPFIPYYIATMGDFPKETIDYYTGLSSFLLSLGMLAMAPVWGMLADKYGKKSMLQRSMTFGCITMALLSFAQTPTQVMLLRFSQGLFTGTIAASSCYIGTYAPKSRMSYSLGLLASANAIGFAIGPAIGGLVADLTDYKISFLIGASIMSIALFTITFFLKEPKIQINKEKKEEYIEHKHQKNCKQNTCECKHHLLFFTKNQVYDGISKIDYLFMSMLGMIKFLITFFMPYLPLYIMSLSRNLDHISSKIGIINLLLGISTALAGVTLVKFADRKNKNILTRNILLFTMLISIMMYLSHTIVSFIILYIVFQYLMSSIEPITVSNNATSTQMHNKGVFFGMQSMIQSIGSMISPVAATFLAIHFGYKSIILAMPLCIIFLLFTNEWIIGLMYPNNKNKLIHILKH